MTTKADIQAFIEKRLRQEVVRTVDGSYVRDALAGGLTAAEWNGIAVAFRVNDLNGIGNFIVSKVRSKINIDAVAEAEAMLLDDAFSLDEFARIAGL